MSIDRNKNASMSPEKKLLLVNYMNKESRELTWVYMDILNTEEALEKYLELRSSILLYHHIESYNMSTQGWDLDGILDDIKQSFFSELYMWLEMAHLDNIVMETLKEMSLCWNTSENLQNMAKYEMILLKDTLNEIIRNNLRRIPKDTTKITLLELILSQRSELIKIANNYKINTIIDLCSNHIRKILDK